MADARASQAREIYKYAREVTINNSSVGSSGNTEYGERVQSTIKELENQLETELSALREEEAASKKSSMISLEQSENPIVLLRQREVITAAYKQLAEAKPDLPSKNSLLPSLIALRAASQASSGTRELVPETQADLKSARQQLAAEKKRLAAFRLLRSTLEERIIELQDESVRLQSLSAEDVARERISELQAKEVDLHAEANELGGELKWFINEHLGPMLAADQLGGPPVGDLQDITDDMLGAGFTDAGKLKQSKEDSQELMRKGREHRQNTSKELRKLMQDLLNAATGSSSDGSEWVEISESSRVAQYLITAKVAMFHPKDARKIRLLEFTD